MATGLNLGKKLGQVIVDRRAERLAGENRIECGFRVVTGRHSVLATRWTFGDAELSRGAITFRAALGPVRGRWAEPVTVVVRGVDRGSMRPPAAAELWRVDATDCFVRIASERAVVEWKLAAARSTWAVDVVDPDLPEAPARSEDPART